MFDRIKKALFKSPTREAGESVAAPASMFSEWAETQGFAFSDRGEGQGFSLQGTVGGKPWRMERGRPSRSFIRGEELRARAELGISDDVSVLVLNRPLKDMLEKKAYQLYTDSLQTTADPNLPEEMRWLAMYEEFGWQELPRTFWNRYSVLSDDRAHAVQWLQPTLAELMLNWPTPGPHADVPFVLMLMRGKAYLRMEFTPADTGTLEHAAKIFTAACDAASGNLSADIVL